MHGPEELILLRAQFPGRALDLDTEHLPFPDPENVRSPLLVESSRRSAVDTFSRVVGTHALILPSLALRLEVEPSQDSFFNVFL